MLILKLLSEYQIINWCLLNSLQVYMTFWLLEINVIEDFVLSTWKLRPGRGSLVTIHD